MKLSLQAVRAITFIGSTTAFIAMNFNACSDVSFETQTVQSSLGDPVVPTPSVPEPVVPEPEAVDPCEGLSNCVLHKHVITAKAPTDKVDIIVIVDNSGSMTEDIESLGKQISGLTNVLTGLDWQMCLTTTDLYEEAGRFKDWKKNFGNKQIQSTGEHVLKPTMDGFAEIFNTTMANFNSEGNGEERGIAAANLSLYHPSNQDCFRNEAVLMTLVISDEDEFSCGGLCKNMPGPADKPNKYSKQYHPLDPLWDTPAAFKQHVELRWDNQKIAVSHSLIIRPGDQTCYNQQDSFHAAFYGHTYAELTETTGGILGDICALEQSYTEQLEAMGESTVEALDSVVLECIPIGEVTVTPVISSTLSVTGSRLNFSPALTPGTEIVATYYCVE